MEFIIDANQIEDVDFSGASIYLDACFIITYLDKTDPRRENVINALAEWSDQNLRLAISNHTVSEVINRLFQTIILTCLDAFHRNNHLINNRKNGYNRLNVEEKEKMMNLKTASFLYRVAKNTGLLEVYRNRKVSANINELIKAVKNDYPTKRDLLDIFYHRAVIIFEELYHRIIQELDIPIDILPSGFEEYQLAKLHMRLTQLDSTDSLHLAVAHTNQCKYLATLDSDFVHNYYNELKDFQTLILKIA